MYIPVNRSTTATPTRSGPPPGSTVGQARDAHHPAHALDDEVVARAIGVRPVLPEAGDRGDDQRGIGRAKSFRVEAELLQPADLEVLDDDVALLGEPAHQRGAFGLGEVDRRRLLPAIGAQEIGGDALVALAVPGRAPMARVVARVQAVRS